MLDCPFNLSSSSYKLDVGGRVECAAGPEVPYGAEPLQNHRRNPAPDQRVGPISRRRGLCRQRVIVGEIVLLKKLEGDGHLL